MTATPRRYFPSHSILRSFEAAARHGSFTLAAQELHLTQSAISKQVKELELTVGTPLFRRYGRGVEITDAGRNLAEGLAIDLENMRRTVMRAVSAGKMGAALRVATLPAFASRWLIPRLPTFYKKHPNIEVSLSTRLKKINLDEERFDLAIHFGRSDWPGADMKFLCNENLIPVVSPKFAASHEIRSALDLQHVPLLHLTTRPFAWQEFLEYAGKEDVNTLPGKFFDQFIMIISAAVSSLGAGLIPSYLIEEELRTGALLPLSDAGMVTQNSYFLATPAGRENVNVQIFCDWMHSCISETQSKL